MAETTTNMPESVGLRTVGEICGMFGITRKTMFYYDRIGLLKPAVRIGTGAYKMYGETEIRRLEMILKYRDAGLSIQEVRDVLDAGPSEQRKILNRVLERLEAQKSELEQKEIRIRNLLACPEG